MLPEKNPSNQTTIFTVMSALAQQHKAINLSQGFPDFPIAPELARLVGDAVQQGYNQYAPMAGLPALQEAISKKIQHFQKVSIDPYTEITITPGATYAIYCSLACLLEKGDEVIVLEPAYDSYAPNIYSNGGVPVGVPLNPADFSVDWNRVREAITKKTKAIVLNNPHNPSGTVWSAEDFRALSELLSLHHLYVIADEVYEHLVFDQQPHLSVLQFPELRQRSFAVYSFGKVYHATGWKVGYCVAPAEYSAAFRKIHQYMAFSVNSSMQYALAQYLQDFQPLSDSRLMLQNKRDFFLKQMEGTAFTWAKPAAGSYFQLMSYASISDLPDKEFASWLTEHAGVAAIPLSPFYQQDYQGKWLRFCFAKQEETLEQAAINLRKL